MPETRPYGSWPSPITSDLIVAETIGLTDVLLDGGDVYWLERRPREGGRTVLVRRSATGEVTDINPAPFNVRTRVHEYGGGAALVAAGTAYYSHFADQRLYRQAPGEEPVPLTPNPPVRAGLRYGDGLIDPFRKRWIGVREDHRDTGDEPVNTLLAIDLEQGGPGEILVSGADFYSSPRLSPDGLRLAWLTWNHPDMPWVSTELWLAEWNPDGSLQTPVRVAGGGGESIFQPEWSPEGRLHFISDRTGWWNLYRHEDGAAQPLCPLEAEFGEPQWGLGMSTYAFAGPDRIVCAYHSHGLGRLAVLNPGTGTLTPLDLPYTEFGYVRAAGSQVAFLGASPLRPRAVVLLDLESGEPQELQVSHTLAERPEIRRCFSEPESVEFPTAGGKTAFGMFYPPHHPDYQAPEGEQPPLVVMCHGGPTAATGSALSLGIQYWTSRGIAVFDVDYGGSTGYGREYRDRLQGQWGIVDVDDCVHGARYLAGQGRVDGDRMVITGGSAGGYTTLACLAFRDVFRGGASHFGVSDLEALARDTHKFESRYLDWLIGPYPQEKALYEQRSPVHHADLVQVPVTFFQGSEDEVVPPNQTEMMVEALRRRGIPVGYLLFQGEQHGFRKAENIKRALDAELYFYATHVFGIGLTF